MQEVVIALAGEGETNLRLLERFTLRTGAAATALFGLFVFTPLATVWYGTVSGLSPELASFALLPGALLVLLPFLESVLSYQRGVLVRSHKTTPIGVAVAVQLVVTSAIFALTLLALKTVGAVAVGPALTVGYASGVAVLFYNARKTSNRR